jgi:hypothetical protein
MLRAGGYRVEEGTFGAPYSVTLSESYSRIISEARLPGYAEQEIVVIDLDAPAPLDQARGELDSSLGTMAVWAQHNVGVIDPRPEWMWRFDGTAARVFAHGGVFIAFTAPRSPRIYAWANKEHGSLHIQDQLNVDNWSFLPFLRREDLTVKSDHGRDIRASETAKGLLIPTIKRHCESFSVTLQASYRLGERFVPLATNKFGDVVSAAITGEDEEAGLVLLVPRVQDPGAFLLELFQEVLPEVVPRLFPHIEGGRWVERDEYELPRISALKREIGDVRRTADAKVTSLEAEIEVERTEWGWMHGLLTRTGAPLVAAVATAMRTIGFVEVVDCDADVDSGLSGDLREDLQVRDRSPMLLVEVKGIGGLPREAGSLQVTKYLAPRMKELQRFDIQGLSIINHQRNVPGLDRNHRETFQRDVLTNAEDNGFGVMTTWDLFRLIRNALRLGWPMEHVQEILYSTGRIEPVPGHYEYLGTVSDYWEKAGAIAIDLSGGSLSVGDRVSYELPVDFVEEVVTSLQVDGEARDAVETGTVAGLATGFGLTIARKGTRVFRVRSA